MLLCKSIRKRIYFEDQNKFNIYNIRQLIGNNINDIEQIFIINNRIIKSIFNYANEKEDHNDKEYIYYLGSLFEEDKFNEIYSTKAITKIKYYLEPIILILKNLSTTYASLYDLFNQRFTYSL